MAALVVKWSNDRKPDILKPFSICFSTFCCTQIGIQTSGFFISRKKGKRLPDNRQSSEWSASRVL